MTPEQIVRCTTCGLQHQLKERILSGESAFVRDFVCPRCGGCAIEMLIAPDFELVAKAVKADAIDLSTVHEVSGAAGLACPTCGKILDNATGGSRQPGPGDFTVSICCAEPLQYVRAAGGLGLRRLTPGELEALPEEVAVQIALFIAAVKETKAGRRAAGL